MSEKLRSKTPRSPGYVPQDYSIGRLEFQDTKRSTDELKDFAQTSPPNRVVSQPVIERNPMHGLSRTDSGRRRRILESIADSDSRRSKPLKRLLYRLNKPATTSDLTPISVSKRSIEIASKQSSGGRKYMKIVFDPKLYTSNHPSAYKINFQELENGRSGISEQHSHLLDSTEDYSKKLKAEYPHLILGNGFGEPAVAVVSETNEGYSPSKGIPEPELGPEFPESAAATLAMAQAHARTSEQVSKSPERRKVQCRQHGSTVPAHGNHANHWRPSSRGPHSVPIKFQMRPQRNSLPKTPRTSLDESNKLKDTSPVVNGKVKATSTVSGTDSFADDVQSEIEPGEIMNAQREEFIHGQGTFSYHTPTSQKPPRSGPAPTRALPSLPETHDSSVPMAIKTESNGHSGAHSQSAPSSSPKPTTSKSPSKGHRYRLSPVKNNTRKDVSPTLVLKPSPTLTDDFPRPPRSVVPAGPDRSPDGSPACRNREAYISRVMGGLRVDAQIRHDAAISHENGNHQVVAGVEEFPPSADPDKDNLYIPWYESRVNSVKALRLRDIERLRSRQDSAVSPKSTEGEILSAQAHEPKNTEVASPVCPTQSSPETLLENTEPLHPYTHLDPNNKHRRQSPPLHPHSDFSPIVVVTSQPPCPPIDPALDASINTAPITRPSPAPFAATSPTKPNDISQPYLQPPSPRPSLNRDPTPSSFTAAGGQDLPSSSSRPYSYSSLNHSQSYTAELEARIAAMEKKNLLLERAFMAVIDATSSFGYSGASARISGGGGSGCEAASGATAAMQKDRE
ncbi:MAG: hypothetical protein Q9210_001555 [Variospora velana]